MANPAMLLPPGFRFHPTDEELILHYLRNRAASLPCPIAIIAEVDIYKFDPWDLPAKAMFGDREWYFFTPRDRKYPNGYRPNRAAASGYWKATGTDKPILAGGKRGGGQTIGVKKALVFYQGKPPRGVKTEWIMHEYRLAEAENKNNYKPKKLRDSSMRLDDWVLCRIYKKGSHQSGADAEKEDSAVEDAFISTPSSSITHHEDPAAKLSKSYSLSELLDAADYSALARLLEHPPDALGLYNNSAGFPAASTAAESSSYFVSQLPQAEPPRNLKRQWTANGCFEFPGEASPAAKRGSNLSNRSNYMIQPPFFNQQLSFQYPS